MQLDDIRRNVEEVVKHFLEESKKVQSLEELSKLRNSSIRSLKAFLAEIPKLAPEERALLGKMVNTAISQVQEEAEKVSSWLQEKVFDIKDKELELDITTPWLKGGLESYSLPLEQGALHPITREIRRMIEIFTQMGFDVYLGKELDIDKYVFDYLNIPPDHPAREAWDTFYTEEGYIPTTHTSNMQIRVIRDQMKKYNEVYAIVVGKTFRNEELDARHSHTFYQMEGVVVTEDASLGQLLYTLKTFLSYYFRKELRYKVLPAHFPFVEPGLEFAVECVFCEHETTCSVCGGKKWLEIVGAGMIHPQVLKNAGVDPKKYKGFAWGFGIDRLVMSKHKIDDIRDLYQNNINMLTPVR